MAGCETGTRCVLFRVHEVQGWIQGVKQGPDACYLECMKYRGGSRA